MNLQHLFENNPNNYIFDPLKIQIVNDTVELLPTVIGAEAYAFWKMDDNPEDEVFIDSSGNSRDLRFANYTSVNKVPAKINNGLQGNAAPDSGFCRYGVGSNEFGFDRSNPFSLECWLKYTGTTTQFFISKQSDAGIGYSVNTLIVGKIRFVIRDTVGNLIVVETALTYNDGFFHHLACTYSGNSAETGMKIYVDNVLDTVVSSVGTLTNTIVDNNVSFQISGRDGSNDTINDNTIMDEVVVYDREITAAEVAFRWNLGAGTQQLPGASTSYPTDNPTIRPVRSQIINELISFTSSLIETGNDLVKFIIDINGVNYYYNTVDSEWQISDGFLKSNTPAEILANIATLNSDIIQNTLVGYNWLAYMHSDDGSTTPKLENVKSEYNAFSQGVNLNENTYEGNLFFIDGIPANTKWLTVRSIKYNWGTNSQITNDPRPVIIQNNGNFIASVYNEDTEPDELLWNFEGFKVKTNFLAGNRKFSELTRISES